MSKRKSGSPRRQHIRQTIGLVVEGDTEFIAFPYLHTKKLLKNCPPLKPTNLKGVGSHLKPEGIARMVAPKVKTHLIAGRHKVVVCLDLEGRADCPSDFATSIHKNISKILMEENFSAKSVHVVVLNRTFEAILLAGSKALYKKCLFKKEYGGHCFEGKMGRQGRKGVVELNELLGREYSKTTDGPKLFEKLDLSEARKFGLGEHGSKSLNKLLKTLESKK